MRHRAERRQAVLHRVKDVAGAGELFAQVVFQREDHLFVPVLREAAARAVVGDLAVGEFRARAEQLDLLARAARGLRRRPAALRVAEVDLVDDREHRDLEQDRVQPRTLDVDVDLAVALGRRRDRNVLLVQMEEREELDEIALDEAHAPQVVEFVVGKAQLAQLAHFIADLVDIRHEIDIRRAATKAVLHARRRKMMQTPPASS